MFQSLNKFLVLRFLSKILDPVKLRFFLQSADKFHEFTFRMQKARSSASLNAQDFNEDRQRSLL